MEGLGRVGVGCGESLGDVPVGSVLSVLRSDECLSAWIDGLAGFGSGIEVGLPAGDELVSVLLDLAVPHEDVNELLAARAAVYADPGLHDLFERSVRALVAGIGTIDQRLELPALPDELGAVGRYFHICVFIAARPHVLAYHHDLGIPADVSRRTLADLGRHLAVHRRRRGTGGLIARFWPKLHFRGELYELGRLQFQRSLLGRGAASAAAAGLPYGPRDPALALHIPDFHGPLTPAACDESLALARAFFPRHFPEEPYRVAVCGSWLLDPQLREYLPADSNIIRFQRRFHLETDPTGGDPEDTAAIGFVFGDPALPPETLPRRTSLERAIGDHLRAGRHWYVNVGWFEL
ncbi:acyltransferase domain-containing protein [Embleya sp. NBC_00896]|uniref:acyltransferase domain-containing protein n=1 Tax=Embleya sp. NBC_00896 TaxID=2975961 RepID=UPI00386C497D|nr:acyltransferase domain-containing protein [Embleya sp. NBC_00896]